MKVEGETYGLQYKTMTGTIKGVLRHPRFMLVIPGLTSFKNNLSLLTTPDGGGYGSIMSTTALRVPSEVWLQSNRNIMLHFNGLSWFVPCRWEHCQPTFAKYVSTFLRDVFGESYKRFSLKSVCAELNSKEPLKGIWTSFLSFFFWLWQNIFFFLLVWLRGALQQREDLEWLK